jgi:hypothetical protein
MFGLVTRRRHEAELAAMREEREQQRARADEANEIATAEVAVRRTLNRQLAEADAVNRRLAGRNAELTRRLEENTDAEYTARLETRVERLAKGASRYLAALWTARAEIRELTGLAVRAAVAMEEMEAKVRSAEERARLATQGLRPEEWEARPVDGAPRFRRESPSAELRRAVDRCRALEQQLAGLQASHVADTRELHDLRVNGAAS